MHREYHFQTIWHIQAPPRIASEVLLHQEAWTKWWRGLEQADLQNETIGEGSVVATTWRSNTGYRLRLTLRITTFRPGQYIAFTSSGDLVGGGDFTLAPHNGHTKITINWQVRTTKVWMNILEPFLRPLFVQNHHRLMDAGERGLNRYVADRVNQLQ